MSVITFITSGVFILFSGLVMKKKDSSLSDTRWELKKIHHKDSVQEINTRAIIRFDAEKKRAGGNGSCNTFGGSLIVLNDSISISQIFSTKMYCEGVQQIEDSFFKLLAVINRFEIKNKTLSLFRDNDLLLEFDGS